MTTYNSRLARDEHRWFGREPALWIQAIGAVLSLLVALGLPGLNDAVAAAIVALLVAGAAAYTALHVTPVAPTVFAGVIGAGATLLAALGLHATQAQVGAVAAATAAVMAILTRPQQSPLIR
jgi:hypothetical protein